MKQLKSLTVFFPAYNDERTIGGLVKKVLKILPEVAKDYEVFVINDGSTDNTIKVLEKLTKTYSKLRILNHRKNLGYGSVLKTGFANAKKEFVFYTDGDGQYDVLELKKIVPALKPGIDVVNGYKIKRSDQFYRILIGSAYQWIARLRFPIPIKDLTCDFRLIRRSTIKQINLSYNSGIVCLEMIAKLARNGAVFTEVPVHHYPRPYGHSQYFRPGKILASLRDLINLWRGFS